MILEYIIAVLAVYRLSTLIAEDVIATPLREFWWRRFPVSDYVYNAHQVRDKNETGNVGEVRAWPFRREVYLDADYGWVPIKFYKTGELVECVYCVSIWFSAAVAFWYFNPGGWSSVFLFLAIAGGVEIVNNVAGRN